MDKAAIASFSSACHNNPEFGDKQIRHAETVTLGGSGLERAAELQDNPERLAILHDTGETVVLWCGKPLFDYESKPLLRLP